MVRCFLVLALIIGSPVWSGSVVDSVAAQMDRLESGEGLHPEKYSGCQWQEIQRALAARKDRIRVMSYNMLFNLHEEQLEPQHHWQRRLPRIIALIQTNAPDIIGSQELQADQLQDVLENLGETYAFFGRGTVDGQTSGEINGVFYRKERFKPLLCKVWWMSPTPETPSPDHSISLARTLTMVQLFDKTTQQRLAVFNTHFSFSSPNSRDESARFAAQLTAHYAAEIPVILTGDFNFFANRPDLRDLPFFDGSHAFRLLTSRGLEDSASVSVLGHIGPLSTYTNQGNDLTPFTGVGEPGIVLDHIFVSPQICVLLHATDPSRINGNFPSDHLPVMADCILWK